MQLFPFQFQVLQAHPTLKKWRTTPFPLFDEMADLVEGTYATGAGVFRPGRDFTPDPDSSSDGGAGEDDTIDPLLKPHLPS